MKNVSLLKLKYYFEWQFTESKKVSKMKLNVSFMYHVTCGTVYIYILQTVKVWCCFWSFYFNRFLLFKGRTFSSGVWHFTYSDVMNIFQLFQPFTVVHLLRDKLANFSTEMPLQDFDIPSAIWNPFAHMQSIQIKSVDGQNFPFACVPTFHVCVKTNIFF